MKVTTQHVIIACATAACIGLMYQVFDIKENHRLMSAQFTDSGQDTTISYVIDKESITKHEPDLISATSDSNIISHSLSANDNYTAIIILTYMRSGSTFVGNIMQQSPESFYVFEPFRAITNALKAGKPIRLNNGQLKYLKKNDLTHWKALIVMSYFSCRLEDLPMSVLRDNFHVFSNAGKKYMACLRRQKGNDTSCATCDACLGSFKDACLQSKYRIIKTIRLSMDSTKDLLLRHPNWKVIHLIRDPRGRINSQMQYGFVRSINVNEASFSQCKTLLDDIETFESMEESIQNRVMLFRYEDIVRNPTKLAKSMYDFSLIEYDSKIDQYIDGITAADNECGGNMCVVKSNSTKTMLTWRTKMKFSVATEIDKNCGNVYTKIGYLKISSEAAMRDLSVQLTV